MLFVENKPWYYSLYKFELCYAFHKCFGKLIIRNSKYKNTDPDLDIL